MEKFQIKYRTYGKAQPPRPIRMKVPGWGGSAEKMQDGSEPQPWHCLPFTEGSTYGLELVYEYDNECHVINDDGQIRFEWDYAHETGVELNGGEFVTFYPKPYSKFYLFNTSLDMQAPPGFVIATHAHPRFFTDEKGTVPISLTGHVQTEWWPKKFFVVFKAPAPGQRHIFRKGEPYVELRVLPQRARYELELMGDQEESDRRILERDILKTATEIASNVWHNPSGYTFNNHYKLLAAAFAREGGAGVKQLVSDAGASQESLPPSATTAEYLTLGQKLFAHRKYNEAKHLYVQLLNREPANAEAVNRLGVITAVQGMPMLALKLMQQAVALQPRSTVYLDDLGELYRRMERFPDAEAAFRASLQIDPGNVKAWSNFGLTLAQHGRVAEGIDACRRALSIRSDLPGPHYRLGVILAQQYRFDEARDCFNAALAIDANYAEAADALNALPSA